MQARSWKDHGPIRLEDPLLPRDQVPPGLDTGECVPLSIEEFRHAYATFGAVHAGRRPPDPDFPTMILDTESGEAKPLEDTRFNRAWFAAGKEFDNKAKRISFYWRVEHVLPIVFEKKYDKYRNREALRLALVMAVVKVPGGYRTPKKALRAEFDALFHRNLAVMVDPGGASTRH